MSSDKKFKIISFDSKSKSDLEKAVGRIPPIGTITFICESMKLKNQVICSQNTLVRQA